MMMDKSNQVSTSSVMELNKTGSTKFVVGPSLTNTTEFKETSMMMDKSNQLSTSSAMELNKTEPTMFVIGPSLTNTTEFRETSIMVDNGDQFATASDSAMELNKTEPTTFVIEPLLTNTTNFKETSMMIDKSNQLSTGSVMELNKTESTMFVVGPSLTNTTEFKETSIMVDKSVQLSTSSAMELNRTEPTMFVVGPSLTNTTEFKETSMRMDKSNQLSTRSAMELNKTEPTMFVIGPSLTNTTEFRETSIIVDKSDQLATVTSSGSAIELNKTEPTMLAVGPSLTNTTEFRETSIMVDKSDQFPTVTSSGSAMELNKTESTMLAVGPSLTNNTEFRETIVLGDKSDQLPTGCMVPEQNKNAGLESYIASVLQPIPTFCKKKRKLKRMHVPRMIGTRNSPIPFGSLSKVVVSAPLNRHIPSSLASKFTPNHATPFFKTRAKQAATISTTVGGVNDVPGWNIYGGGPATAGDDNDVSVLDIYGCDPGAMATVNGDNDVPVSVWNVSQHGVGGTKNLDRGGVLGCLGDEDCSKWLGGRDVGSGVGDRKVDGGRGEDYDGSVPKFVAAVTCAQTINHSSHLEMSSSCIEQSGLDYQAIFGNQSNLHQSCDMAALSGAQAINVETPEVVLISPPHKVVQADNGFFASSNDTMQNETLQLRRQSLMFSPSVLSKFILNAHSNETLGSQTTPDTASCNLPSYLCSDVLVSSSSLLPCSLHSVPVVMSIPSVDVVCNSSSSKLRTSTQLTDIPPVSAFSSSYICSPPRENSSATCPDLQDISTHNCEPYIDASLSTNISGDTFINHMNYMCLQ